MALRAGVPVVPVTISDVARWYPKVTARLRPPPAAFPPDLPHAGPSRLLMCV